MLVKTKGIVLRAIKYGETSIITDIYTLERGLQTFIVSGVRTSKSRIHASLLQLGTIVELVAYIREETKMNRVKEVHAAMVYTTIPFKILKSSVALFMVELAQKTVKESESNPSLFEFLATSFYHLDTTTESVLNLPIAFMVHLSEYLGFQPTTNERPNFFDLKDGQFFAEEPLHQYFLNPIYSQLLIQFLETDLENVHLIEINGADRRYLLMRLCDYYRMHATNFQIPNTIAVLQEVL
jgi:DNA repair protein RecO (recombination protein O)